MRGPGVAILNGRPRDLTLHPKNTKEEALHPVEGFAPLRLPGFGLMTISDANLVGLIRPTRPSTHEPKATKSGASLGEASLLICSAYPRQIGIGNASLDVYRWGTGPSPPS